MATGARSKARYARRIRLGGRAAQLIGPLAFSMLVLLGGILVSPPADLAQLCGDRGEILNRLEQGQCPPPASCAATRSRPKAAGPCPSPVPSARLEPETGHRGRSGPARVIAIDKAWGTPPPTGQPV